VTELSGGEQQRVALARSLAPGPRLLMLDEPLGALDRALREQLMNDLRAILKRVGVTTLYVTHDQAEAFAIADAVQIMQARLDVGEGGRVVQAGPPEAVYRRPATAYVARFLGFRNLLEGTVASAPGRDDAQYAVDTPLGRLHAGDVSGDYPPGARVAVLIRPEAADVLPAEAAGSAPNVIPGRLASSSFRGSYFLVQTEHADGVTLTCEVPVTDAHLPAPGEPLALHLNPQAITLLEP
jgi:ABC-type Fe3+/spermidine/putrescine transport system ATPase subunit